MSIASWSRTYFGQIEIGDNTIGTPDGSDLTNNLPALLASTEPTLGVDDIGIEGNGTTGGKHKMLLSNKPSLDSNTAVQDDRKATGSPDPSEKDIEVTIGEPSTPELEMNMSAYVANIGLLLLFQQGSTEAFIASLKTTEAVTTLTVIDDVTTTIAGTGIGTDVPDIGKVINSTTGEIFSYTAVTARPAGDFTGCTRGELGTTAAAMSGEAGGMCLTKTKFVPYSTAEALYYMALIEKVRKLYGGTPYDASVLLRGCIANTFNMEFEEGGVAKATIGLLGAKWQNDFDMSSLTSTASAIATLKWQNSFVYLMDFDATPLSTDHKIWLQSLSLSGTNNASAHFYNSEEVKNFTLGDTVFTGNIVLPWVANAERAQYYWEQIDTFRANGKKRLIVGWGHEGATNLTELGQADNGFKIDAFIQYNSATRGGDNQVVNELEFKNILPEGEAQSIQFYTFTETEKLVRGLPATA